jgi:hypothetical protein
VGDARAQANPQKAAVTVAGVTAARPMTSAYRAARRCCVGERTVISPTGGRRKSRIAHIRNNFATGAFALRFVAGRSRTYGMDDVLGLRAARNGFTAPVP